MGMKSKSWLAWAPLCVLVTACGGDPEAARERMIQRADETSRQVAAAEWHYDREQRPPERGDTAPIEEDRCRVDMPGEDRLVDVACGLFFMAMEPQVDSAWIDRLVASLGGEVVERERLPAWATRLDEEVPYVLVSVPLGQEPVAIRRALASEGVRLVDVRRVQRRRP
jgi:hypothetical protein